MDSTDKRKFTSPKNGILGGVRTDEGKATSSKNSLKHGIFSQTNAAIDDISYDEVYAQFADEFGDETPSRQVLISQAAILCLRLRRCGRFEFEFIRSRLNPLCSEFDDSRSPMTIQLKSLSELENVYTKYEPQFLSRFCAIISILSRSDK